jgi:transposase
MEIVFDCCAGIDVPKRTVVVCRLTRDARGGRVVQTQTFGTTTGDLLRLADWLTEGGCTHVGLESTGEFWKPVFNLLEGAFEVWLLNAAHIKAVPGRKTDVRDAQWIAERLAHGLVRPSFIPPRPQRELRDLTRYRTTFVRERATLVNRVHKVLAGANLKLAAVATDIRGVSGRALLAALRARRTQRSWPSWPKGRCARSARNSSRRCGVRHLRPHQRFVLSDLLAQIDSLEETIARFSAQSEATCAQDAAEAEVVALLDTIPGLSQATAQVVVAEIGTNMSRFPSAAALASWAGLAPGNHERAGRQRSGRTRKGNVWLRTILVQAAQAAAHTKDTALVARYRRIAARRGHKKAIVALAHALLVIIYHVIARRQPYQDFGEDSFQHYDPTARAKRLVHQLTHLGFEVQLRAQQTTAAMPNALALTAGS